MAAYRTRSADVASHPCLSLRILRADIDRMPLAQATLSFGTTLRLQTPARSEASHPSTITTLDATMTEAPSLRSPSVAASESSSILSSAAAYLRRDSKVKLESGPSEVRVHLNLRLIAGGSAVVTTVSVKRHALVVPGLKSKRRKYDKPAKQKIIECAREYGVAEAVRRAGNQLGWEHLRPDQVTRWKRLIAAVPKRQGRPPTPPDFNQAVMSFLIFTSVEKIGTDTRLRVEANIAYKYDMIRQSALLAQKQPQFAAVKQVQECKFSNKWIGNWLKAVNCRRRRTTTTEKQLPPAAQVREHMLEIQEQLDDYEEDEVISSDETGVFYGAQPLNQYVPDDARRGVAPPSDEKARITAMLWGTCRFMGPVFLIIKCSSKGYDLTNTRVLQNLHALPGFTSSDGWTIHVWRANVKLKIKKELVDVAVIIPYLLHTDDHIITLQSRAWMDTVRLCMWLDLQLGPFYAKRRGRCANVWDNCGPHGTQAVQEYAEKWGINNLPLPQNMTDVLQVMDLAVNSPVKSGIRADRCQFLFEYFQQWKVERLRAEIAKKEPPIFSPPKPTLQSGIKTLIKVVTIDLATPAFLGSMRRCFKDVGLIPITETATDRTYRNYEEHKHGSLNPNLFPNLPASGTLGELVAVESGAEPVTRLEALDNLEDQSDTSDEDSGDEEEG